MMPYPDAFLLEVMPMTVYQVIANPKERRSAVSTNDTLQLMMGFGMFTIALIALIVELINNQQKK